LNVTDPKISFKHYNNDGNRYIDTFVIMHLGAGAERTRKGNDIWSHKWVLEGGLYQVDETQIFSFLTVPGDCKLGMCTHELGHLAFGWPDLYNVDYTSEGVDVWCLMATDSYNSDESNPNMRCTWCKVD